MSFKYYTKTLEELQEISNVIVNNFSPLVGCKQNSKKWSPATAFGVCSKLNISGFECTNIAKDSIKLGFVKESFELRSPLESPLHYEFDTTVSETAKQLWYSGLKLESSILDTSYMSKLKLNLALPLSERLKQCALKSKDYDSTIYTAIIGNQKLSYTLQTRQLCLILLQTFTLRYALYDFSLGLETTLNNTTINRNLVNLLIKNCEYTKYTLGQLDLQCYDFDVSLTYIQQQLTLIIKNCKQLKTYVMEYINL